MQVHPYVQKLIYLIWLLMVPAGLWVTYQIHPPKFSGNWVELLAFLLLTIIVATMPIVINETFIFLIQWVALATFLKFGLFVEIIFAQIAVIALVLKLKILQKGQFFRLPLNLNMFFLVSFISGMTYYWLGGHTGPELAEDYSSLSLAVVYGGLYYLINQVILVIHFKYIYKRKEPFFGSDFVVETITTLITLPIGFIFYILFNEIGLLSILFVGIPFISLSIIFILYYSSQKINDYLQKAAEIGHQLAERLNVDDVKNIFLQKVCEMLPVDYAYILEVMTHKDEKYLLLSGGIEEGEVRTKPLILIRRYEGMSGKVWAEQNSLLLNTRKEWTYSPSSSYIPEDAESMLCVPIIKSKKAIGVLVLASKKKHAYEKSQLMIIEVLCSYFAVAMENAKNYEQTKMQSEHCALTKLYNFRYFQNVLTEEFQKLSSSELKFLSLIILDIDHFKSINDTYGHQSGNEILIEMAQRIESLVGKRGTVARYGGEEFVILLPNVSKAEAVSLAELIRQSVANWPFILHQTIVKEPQQVKITTSIGVATAPEDAEDAQSLIRHADRALYVGAKRAGRNRVAEYSTC
ncbi:sensor domain-containing diguanylate cyclase [Neobacillus sedimentimangrovi]|nr:sensor domain-containing diguanylate cyclase [Neobacillus sedimentimangrovi]